MPNILTSFSEAENKIKEIEKKFQQEKIAIRQELVTYYNNLVMESFEKIGFKCKGSPYTLKKVTEYINYRRGYKTYYKLVLNTNNLPNEIKILKEISYVLRNIKKYKEEYIVNFILDSKNKIKKEQIRLEEVKAKAKERKKIAAKRRAKILAERRKRESSIEGKILKQIGEDESLKRKVLSALTKSMIR